MSPLRSIVICAALVFSNSALASDTVDLLDDETSFAFNEEDLGDLTDLKRGKVETKTKGKKGAEDVKPQFEFEEPEEEFDLLDAPDADEPDEFLGNFESFEEEDEMADSFEQPQSRRISAPAATPGPITLEVAGKSILADNYPLSVIAVDRDAVVIELPVLVAKSRIGLEGAFQLQADVYAGDIKVAQVRQTVEKASLAEFGPSFVFLKVLAPVIEREGQIKIVVKKAGADGRGATELFSRTTPYALR